MAGRPGTVRGGGGGGGGLLYGLIAFVAVAVLSLGGMIFALTNLTAARDQADRYKRDLDKFGAPPSYYSDEAAARGSGTFRTMNDDIEALAQLVAGKKEAVRPALEEKARQVLKAAAAANPEAVPAGSDLLGVVASLDRALAESKKANAALAAQVKELESSRDAMTTGLNTAREEYATSVKELSAEVSRAEQEKNTAIAAKDAQVQSLQSASESAAKEAGQERTNLAAERRENEIRTGKLSTQIGDLQSQIKGLKSTEFDPDAILRQADARVLRAIPGSDVIYLSIGAKDGVRPGIGFDVYSPTPDSRQTVRGKASVEAVTVLPEVTECRVLRSTPGQPIIEDDLAVNIAFARNRKPKFVVRGSFDLNYDGQVDDNDLQRVTAMIREWGGQVVPNLDETVDFVLIGVAPVVPSTPPGQPVSPIMQVQIERQELEGKAFQDLINKARSMYIPVITQSQFLFLTGFSGDTTIHQRGS